SRPSLIASCSCATVNSLNRVGAWREFCESCPFWAPSVTAAADISRTLQVKTRRPLALEDMQLLLSKPHYPWERTRPERAIYVPRREESRTNALPQNGIRWSTAAQQVPAHPAVAEKTVRVGLVALTVAER